MKKVLVLLVVIGSFFSSCSSDKDKTKKEKVINALIVKYKDQKIDVFDFPFIIPNYKKKGDTISICKIGNNWSYSYDTTSANKIKVVVDSVIYKNQ